MDYRAAFMGEQQGLMLGEPHTKKVTTGLILTDVKYTRFGQETGDYVPIS